MVAQVRTNSDPGSFRWADKRVLVFGASGFLGRHLTSALVQRGAQVYASSRQRRDSTQPGLTWLVTDVTSLDSVKASISRVRPHAVFHFSSLANGRPDLSLTLPTLHAEVLSTVNVLIASVDARVERVVLPGSLEEPEDGDAPSSPYAAANLRSTYPRSPTFTATGRNSDETCANQESEPVPAPLETLRSQISRQ